MKFKLPCFHKRLQYLERRSDDNAPYVCQCMECKKIICRKREIPHHKHGRDNYSWCSCGNDLLRDSFIGKVENNISNLTIYKYLCSLCGKESFWTFDIGLSPLRLSIDEEGNVKKYK